MAGADGAVAGLPGHSCEASEVTVPRWRTTVRAAHHQGSARRWHPAPDRGSHQCLQGGVFQGRHVTGENQPCGAGCAARRPWGCRSQYRGFVNKQGELLAQGTLACPANRNMYGRRQGRRSATLRAKSVRPSISSAALSRPCATLATGEQSAGPADSWGRTVGADIGLATRLGNGRISV